jgi:hypothetical protein
MVAAARLDPLELLNLARELARRPDAAAVRTACDRAYYAAFLFCRDQLISMGIVERAGGRGRTRRPRLTGRSADHTIIPDSLRGLANGRRPGNELNRLREQRNQYTYNTGSLSTSAVATPQWMLSTAEDIIGFVQQLTPSA